MKIDPTSMTATEAQAVCQWCDVVEIDGNFEHLDWCKEITSKIYSRFNSTFREIYNVIELSLDKEKAEIAKDLIGNTIMKTRNDCTKLAANYFLKNSKL